MWQEKEKLQDQSIAGLVGEEPGGDWEREGSPGQMVTSAREAPDQDRKQFSVCKMEVTAYLGQGYCHQIVVREAWPVWRGGDAECPDNSSKNFRHKRQRNGMAAGDSLTD